MERTEWPTRAKLESLREEGKVPYSRLCVCSAVAMALFCSLFYVVDSFAFVVEKWRQMMESIVIFDPTGLEVLVRPLAVALFLPLLVTFFVAFIAALLQSRFLFRWHLVKMEFARLRGWQSWRFGEFLLQLLFSVLTVLLVLFLSCLLLIGSSRNLFGLLNGGQTGWLAWLGSLLAHVSVWLMPLLLSFGFGAWLVARLVFRIRHRMTRQEIMHEQED